jgi:hypothetical protein
VTEATAWIMANVGITTVANTNVFIAVTDGTNTAIYQYQEGALDQGIQAGELTLVTIVAGSGITGGDLV